MLAFYVCTFLISVKLGNTQPKVNNAYALFWRKGSGDVQMCGCADVRMCGFADALAPAYVPLVDMCKIMNM